MKSPCARRFRSISVTVLLISSFFVLASNSVSQASSTGSDDVGGASGSNRFVVWYDNTPGSFDVLFRRSADNGATWKSIVNLSNNTGDSNSAQIAVAGSNVYVVWSDSSPGNYEIFLRRSTDNGATWKSIVNLSNNPGPSLGPQIVVAGPKVYVVWTQQAADTSGTDIFFRRSTDNGASWKFFKNLSQSGDSDSPQLAVSGSNVYVVWDDYPAYEVYFRRSTDNGATWQPIINLSSNSVPSSVPHIAASGSNVYVTWLDQSPTDIFFRRSTNNGATWQTSRNLSTNTSYALGGAIAVSGSNVYVVWMKDRAVNTPDHDAIFRGSTDGGATWGAKVTINSGNLSFGDQPLVAASGANVYVVWTERPAGDTYFRRSTDNGATWISIVNLSNNPGNSYYSEIAVSGANLYVAWNNSGGNTEILSRRSTDNGATWKATVNMSSNSGGSFDAQFGV